MKNQLTQSVWMASLTMSGVLLTAQAQPAAQTQPATQAPDQTQQAAPQDGQHHHHGHTPNPQHETKWLTKRLGLSAEQAAQVEPILAERAQKLAALKSASGTQTDSASLHDQHRAIQQQTEQKLDTVLTPAQQQELAQMHHGHGKHGEGQQPTAPSPSL